MAEEEFGSANHGPLQIPCEEELMDYILSLLRKNNSENADKALASMTTCKGAHNSSPSAADFPLCNSSLFRK
ncbi:Auxin responsive SAUR protein [Corchorus capsularis]|uniref:Auxin responsive SAUR protein n=1 Tax=Corchorus capsularis TaxID=210143 RepID=A0A1R3K7E5_COCAP|nr:Auxin responsive SAUR protein [Corchorus capsularis]